MGRIRFRGVRAVTKIVPDEDHNEKQTPKLEKSRNGILNTPNSGVPITTKRPVVATAVCANI